MVHAGRTDPPLSLPLPAQVLEVIASPTQAQPLRPNNTMADSKQNILMQTLSQPIDDDVASSSDIKGGTTADQQDMQRLGKTQETKVGAMDSLVCWELY